MSCDLKQSKTSGPHYCGSVFDVIDYPWDLAIMHPPCTHTAVSGAAHFAAKRMDGRQQSGVSFFMALWRKSDHIPRVCIEQPISIMSKLFRAVAITDSARVCKTWKEARTVYDHFQPKE